MIELLTVSGEEQKWTAGRNEAVGGKGEFGDTGRHQSFTSGFCGSRISPPRSS